METAFFPAAARGTRARRPEKAANDAAKNFTESPRARLGDFTLGKVDWPRGGRSRWEMKGNAARVVDEDGLIGVGL